MNGNIEKPDRPSKEEFFNKYIEITISKDNMYVDVIYSIYPKDPLQVDDFLRFLKRENIVHGIDESLISQICLNPENFTGRKLRIAQGTLPVDGQDATIIYHFQDQQQDDKIDENERVDFKNINNVYNVHAGELLATKTPPTLGTNGMDVYGKVLPARPGKNIPLRVGKNVVLDETGLKAFAVIDGQISITERDRLNIFPIYEVKGDVDYSTGNIDFVGSVLIRGNVLSGFSVRAGGDIRILGEVEAAELEANGSIEIRSGIVGQGKGFVRAGHNIVASYLNQANVSARNNIIVGSILHSNVRAGKKIVCTKGKGIIIGGNVQAGEMIEVNVIGNISQTPTNLEVGILPDLLNEYNSIKQKLTSIEQDIDKANKSLQLLNRQLVMDRYLPPEKMELRNKLSNTVQSLQSSYNELQERKSEIEVSMEMTEDAGVDVYNIAFPGTKIVIGKYVRHLKLEHRRISFRLREGDIAALPL